LRLDLAFLGDEKMAPEYCPDHSKLMLSMGKVEQRQEYLCTELAEIKEILKAWGEKKDKEADEKVEDKTKKRIFFAAVGTSGVAAISAFTHWLINKLCQ
jgi:hypothetical protein